MLFNSAEFVPFLLLVLLAHYVLVPKTWMRSRKLVLVVASYAFYMSWNPLFGLLLAFSTTLDFFVGLAMRRNVGAVRRRWLLAASLCGNLGLLAFFKYGAFASESLYWLLGWSPADPALRIFRVALPIGISFYTFQTLSYTIDVYRGKRPACQSLLDFALYVSFFPQLVAGPIVRSGDFLPQVARPRSAGPRDFEIGGMRIAVGLAKKVVLADTLGIYVDRVFASPEAVGPLYLLLGVYAYAYQIYLDFSGYSDIAIGLARWFGLRIPENFDHPYLAVSPREFWQRWHISLSTWLRDYLYISLGGNRRGRVATLANLFVTMLLGGLWHGAGWNFVVWGAYHGLLLCGHRVLFGARDPAAARLPVVLRRVATFHLVGFGWLLFRSPSLPAAAAYLESFATPGVGSSREALLALAIVGVAASFQLLTTPSDLRRRLLDLPAPLQGVLYAGVAALAYLFSTSGQRFIYFQF